MGEALEEVLKELWRGFWMSSGEGSRRALEIVLSKLWRASWSSGSRIGELLVDVQFWEPSPRGAEGVLEEVLDGL